MLQSKNIKILIYIIVGIVILSLTGVIFFRSKSNGSAPSGTQVSFREITLSEISKHNTKDSCWTTINGGVYDITSFISKHKGGDRILNACGIDATDLFTGRSPMGRLHSQMAVKLLSSMQIGTLRK